MPEKQQIFTIDARRWRCGMEGTNTPDRIVAFDPDGDAHPHPDPRFKENGTFLSAGPEPIRHGECCLGQIALACGIPRRYIAQKQQPSQIAARFQGKLPEALRKDPDGAHSRVAMDFMQVNDNPRTTIEQKVEAVKKMGAKHGMEVRFTYLDVAINSAKRRAEKALAEREAHEKEIRA